jgi:pyruvate/2-oxoglutarate dehydrogenase complex dihydrolipoamide dehydrogenase (E3) component
VGNSILEGPVAIIISLFLLIIVLSIPKVIRRWRQLGENEYDLIIIGSGSGGLNIAGFMNRAGFKILLVEKNEANIGGDCLNTGCVPSKALIHCARLRKGANEYAKLNSSSKPKSADFKAIKDYLNQKIAQIRQHENKAYFEKLGMQIKIGQAQFISKEEIQVGSDKYWGQKIIIATGSRPFIPKIKGILRVEYQTNETIFGLSKLPQKLLIIGAGPIGIELGSAFANLGSNVKVVQSQERILPKEDAELSQKLQSLLLDEGVKFYLNSRVVEFPTSNTAKIVNKISEKEEIVEFDQVLIATGRYLDFSELNLPAANIKLKNNGQLIVNKKLQTTNKNVLVAGDAAGGYQFTHAAELHASVIINNFFSPFKRKLNYDSFGWVTFTTPEVATFGLNEAELNKRQIEYQVLRKKLDHDDRAITDNYSEQGLIKLFVHKNKRILGGSILAPEAGEIAQELMLAISQKLKAKDLFYRTYPYPVRSRITKSTLSPVFADKLNNTRTRKILKFLYS